MRPKEIKYHFPIRLGACIFSLLETIILHHDSGIIAPWFWSIMVLYTLCYPYLLYKTTKTKEHERINILMDCAVYAVYMAIWGFNPLLSMIMSTGIILTGVMLSGTRGLLIYVFVSCVSAFVFIQVWGFQYRESLSPLNTGVAFICMLFFVGALGHTASKIKSYLSHTKIKESDQREQLENMVEIAQTVNATLDLDLLINSLSDGFARRFPVESILVSMFSDDKNKIEIKGVYGKAFNKKERDYLTNFRVDIGNNENSFFVDTMLNDKVIYHESVSPNIVGKLVGLDLTMYMQKPSLSMAFFPVKIHGEIVAGIGFLNYKKHLVLGDHGITEIKSYLLQVGAALRNIQLFERVKEEKKKAEESEKAKSHFLANMSHEIRTPMTAILGYSEALQDDISMSERKEFTQIIIRGGKHLLSIINDILDISKIEADKVEVEILDVNLALLIKELNDNIKLKAEEKSLSFHLDIQYPIPFDIRIDPTRIKQVLFNLASNAIKFTDKGSITVCVKWKKPGHLIFSIEDTGIGLTQKEQGDLFQSFSQADSSTTRLYGGTGLGLYISQNLVKLMDGDLNVESEKGKGSKFTVKLSMLHDVSDSWINSPEDMQRCIEQLQDEKSVEYVPSLEGRVLVADDTEQNQLLIRRLIEKTGLIVDIVNNGLEAVNQAKKQEYNVIFLDIQMPVMGGKEAAKELRNQNIKTPLIAFTANVMKHQIDEYKQQHFSDVLAKPISREELYRLLTDYITRQHLHRVLIVDDNQVNRMVLARYTSKFIQGIHIDQAEHGVEALKLLGTNTYDLIFMDMEMPIMGGLEATEKIRELGIKTPIYMVTGNIDPSYVRQGKEAGADGHIVKPIDKNRLAEIINGYI